MKQLFCSIMAMVAIAIQGNAQNVGIGTNTPDASALLHVSSTQKGMLIPRMDSIQRNAIASPAQGLLIYQTKGNGGLYHYSGTSWTKVGGGGNEWLVNANNDIYTTKKVGVGTTVPNASAALDISSTDKGVLIPRMTEAQKNGIPTPDGGLLIYQTDGNTGFYFYNGGTTSWKKIGGDGNEWIKNIANNIYTNKNVGIANNNPTEKLDIIGNIKTTGEIKPNGTAGLANQVLTATGTGGMVWANASNGSSSEESTGFGTWGDCSVNGITAFLPVGNEDGQPQDRFGSCVAISGEYAIAGAYNDSEAGLLYNGSATVLKRNAATGVWEAQGKLLNPAGANGDEFGRSVAISGDYAIVGTPYDTEGAGLFQNGSATIFKRNAGTGVWESQGKLVNPGAANNDNFGWSVAISGDYAIVGAKGDDNNTGSATVFKRHTTTGIWESQGKLAIANPGPLSYFGNSVGISGDFAIVGAPEDGTGSATIFKRNTTTGIWEPLPQGKLTDGFGLSFGGSVSISGNYAIVGDIYNNGGVGLTYDGAATIFKRNTTTGMWEKQTKLLNPAAASSDFFGFSVSISGDYAIIGATGDDEGAGLSNNGSASIYKRNGSIWSLVQKFTRPNSNTGEYFGTSVGIDGTAGRFLAGAPDVQSGTGLVFFGKVK